jgi:hypothetical protein
VPLRTGLSARSGLGCFTLPWQVVRTKGSFRLIVAPNRTVQKAPGNGLRHARADEQPTALPRASQEQTVRIVPHGRPFSGDCREPAGRPVLSIANNEPKGEKGTKQTGLCARYSTLGLPHSLKQLYIVRGLDADRMCEVQAGDHAASQGRRADEIAAARRCKSPLILRYCRRFPLTPTRSSPAAYS